MDTLGFPIDADYVENQKFFMDADAPQEVIVWVESPDDTKLWMSAFSGIDKYEFNFKPASIFPSDDDVNANGCSRLLGLLDSGEMTLGKFQVLCLDSDFKFISGFAEEYVCKYKDNKNIFWTRVHSKENVYLNSILVDSIVSHLVGVPVRQLAQSIGTVFQRFSGAIYECYLKILYVQARSDIFSNVVVSQRKSEFIATFEPLKLKPISDEVVFGGCALWDSFCEKLQVLDDALDITIKEQQQLVSFEKYKANLLVGGVSHENIHFFVRGHDLYAVVEELSCKVIESYKKKKIREIVGVTKKSPSASISEFVNSMQPFGICLKTREPIFDGVSFFNETIDAIQMVYK